MGRSRKGSPCIERIAVGETVTLADIRGPGEIRHIWATVAETTPQGRFVLRDLILRIYWDDEDVPLCNVRWVIFSSTVLHEATQ